jgi:hypothetical protein
METANRKDGTLQEGWGKGSRWVRFDKRPSPTNTAPPPPPFFLFVSPDAPSRSTSSDSSHGRTGSMDKIRLVCPWPPAVGRYTAPLRLPASDENSLVWNDLLLLGAFQRRRGCPRVLGGRGLPAWKRPWWASERAALRSPERLQRRGGQFAYGGSAFRGSLMPFVFRSAQSERLVASSHGQTGVGRCGCHDGFALFWPDISVIHCQS